MTDAREMTVVTSRARAAVATTPPPSPGSAAEREGEVTWRRSAVSSSGDSVTSKAVLHRQHRSKESSADESPTRKTVMKYGLPTSHVKCDYPWELWKMKDDLQLKNR